MALIHLYCDESGKFGHSDFTSFCGYVGNSGEWEKFSESWNQIRRFYEVPAIHMSAIMHPEDNPEWLAVKNRWGTEWEERRDEMLARLAMKIQEHTLICVGATVDSAYFDSMPPSEFKEKVEDTHYLAFQDVVLRSIDKVQWDDSDYALGLVLDDDERTAVTCYELFRKLRLWKPEIKKRISGICFVEDSRYPGVQAADMIAYEARRLMFEKKTKGTAIPTGLYVALTRGCDHQPLFYDAATLDKMASPKT
jgi:hypothetical protein